MYFFTRLSHLSWKFGLRSGNNTPTLRNSLLCQSIIHPVICRFFLLTVLQKCHIILLQLIDDEPERGSSRNFSWYYGYAAKGCKKAIGL